MSAIQGWATIEDDAEVVEALRLDAADDMAAMLAGARISCGCDEEDEMEDGGGGENTGRERRAPPAYSELSPHFGVLESAADRWEWQWRRGVPSAESKNNGDDRSACR